MTWGTGQTLLALLSSLVEEDIEETPIHAIGVHAPESMYANTSNGMEIPVIDPIGLGYQNQFWTNMGKRILMELE